MSLNCDLLIMFEFKDIVVYFCCRKVANNFVESPIMKDLPIFCAIRISFSGGGQVFLVIGD